VRFNQLIFFAIILFINIYVSVEASPRGYGKLPQDIQCDKEDRICEYTFQNPVTVQTIISNVEELMDVDALEVAPIILVQNQRTVIFSHKDSDVKDGMLRLFKRFDRSEPNTHNTEVNLVVDIFTVKQQNAKAFEFGFNNFQKNLSSTSDSSSIIGNLSARNTGSEDSASGLIGLTFKNFIWQFQLDNSTINGWSKHHTRLQVPTVDQGHLWFDPDKTKAYYVPVGGLDPVEYFSGVYIAGRVNVDTNNGLEEVQIRGFKLDYTVDESSDEIAGISNKLSNTKSTGTKNLILNHGETEIVHTYMETSESQLNGKSYYGTSKSSNSESYSVYITVTAMLVKKDIYNQAELQVDKNVSVASNTLDVQEQLVDLFSSDVEGGLENGNYTDLFGLKPFLTIDADEERFDLISDIQIIVEYKSDYLSESSLRKKTSLSNFLNKKFYIPQADILKIRGKEVLPYEVKITLDPDYLPKDYSGVMGATYNYLYKMSIGNRHFHLMDSKIIESNSWSYDSAGDEDDYYFMNSVGSNQ
jgi:hypothetical protein